jgi:hypothetical protein
MISIKNGLAYYIWRWIWYYQNDFEKTGALPSDGFDMGRMISIKRRAYLEMDLVW